MAAVIDPAGSTVSLRQARVSDEMTTGVVSCAPETPLRSVARLMAARRIHAVFVFDYGFEDDETTELWGIVSDLDVAAAALGDVSRRTAGDSAVAPLVTIAKDAPLSRAAELMAQTGSPHLVVIDPSTHRPAGVISTLDIARAIAA